MKIHSNDAINQSAAAALAGMSVRRLQQLSRDDDPPPQDANGQYPASEFGEWLKRRHLSGIAKAGVDAIDYAVERARLTKEQADKAALENEVTRGFLVDVRTISDRWAAVGANIKTKILSISTKAAPLVVGVSMPEAKAILERLHHDALSEIAGSPPGVSARVDATQAPEAASTPDGEPVGRQAPKTKPRKQRRAG